MSIFFLSISASATYIINDICRTKIITPYNFNDVLDFHPRSSSKNERQIQHELNTPNRIFLMFIFFPHFAHPIRHLFFILIFLFRIPRHSIPGAKLCAYALQLWVMARGDYVRVCEIFFSVYECLFNKFWWNDDNNFYSYNSCVCASHCWLTAQDHNEHVALLLFQFTSVEMGKEGVKIVRI